MRVLALEPYYGGSHAAFLEGWQAASEHAWTTLTLPARKWKWRMRHAAVTFAREAAARVAAGEAWDVVFCSDMLNVAEFRGLCPAAVRHLPIVLYFHENQFTYPFRYASERDLHFGFVNLYSSAAADAVWFNSAFHRDDFLAAARGALKRMPDFRHLELIDEVRAKARVQHPGVRLISGGPSDRDPADPLHVIWVARWEHDKGPETFFAALRQLKQAGVAFRLSVVGEQFDESPDVFADAEREFAEEIVCWGFQPTRGDYEAALKSADVVVSTAEHEFFGLAVVEAVSAGCCPLLPNRLSYPELVGGAVVSADYLYDGNAAALAQHLTRLAERKRVSGSLVDPSMRESVSRFGWSRRGPALDAALRAASVVSGF
jgi:glycosyltransferase involved in cell wall biosynthesis